MRINLQPKRMLNITRQPLLVTLLDSRPLLLERRVIGVLQQPLELVQVLEELGLGELQRLVDEVAQLGVALVQPPPRRNCPQFISTLPLLCNDMNEEHVLPLVTFENLDTFHSQQ